MAHGFLAYQDSRHNKGYTAAFNKFAWNQSKSIGKALYQKLKDRLGKKTKPEDESVALVAQHSTSEVVPVSVKSVGNTDSIFGGKGLSGFMRGANRGGGIDPDIMGGGLANFASPRRMNKGYDIIDITPVNSSKESDASNFTPMPGGGVGGGLVRVETAIYDLTREVNETKMAMINIATKQMQQADILAQNQSAMQERALMAQQHTLAPSFSGGGTPSSARIKPKKGRGSGIGIPLGRGGGTGKLMKRGSARGLTRAATKIGGKKLGKSVAKMGLKKVPGLGLLMGAGLGLGRLLKGDILGAASELTQGALTTFLPGAGNAMALGLDMITPAMADGGVVHSPTTALIGEEGKEVVTPLNTETFKMMGDGILDSWINRNTEIHRLISGGLKLYQKEEGRFIKGNGNGNMVGKPGGKGWYGHDIPENAPTGPARVLTGLWDALTFDFFDTDKRGSIWENEHGQSRGPGRWLQGFGDAITGNRFDFDRRQQNAPDSAIEARNEMLASKPPNRNSITKYVKSKGVGNDRAQLIAGAGDSAPSSAGGMFDLTQEDFAKMKEQLGDGWATNWQAQVDWVMNSGKLDSYIESNQPSKPVGTPIRNRRGRIVGYTGEGEGMTSAETGGDLINRSSTSNALAAIAQNGENKTVVLNGSEATNTDGGSTPEGTYAGIAFVDTGMDVFANLKLRTIR